MTMRRWQVSDTRLVVDDASRHDLPQILAIYNEVIRSSTAVYSEEEFTTAGGECWFDAKMDHGFPVIVARDASGIVGFGTLGEFRAWPCYRHSVEHSVHVRADCRGRGIGRALVVELVVRASGMRKHVMVAGIDADNAVSIGLHRSLGFTYVGHFHEVGFKFGRWLDLVFMQCILPPTVDSPVK
ncbi:MAG: L-amino acid N-acyltransferase [Gammaproteobacteria bacterium]|jgi:L-amino acid N-acyltransferase YncA|nr:L-amino acid N-acyltransferase [Gammaproteobacteria bacterium]